MLSTIRLSPWPTLSLRKVYGGIGRDIDDSHSHAQRNLPFPRQPFRVDDGHQVVRDESAIVPLAARQPAQAVFQRGQRADAAAEFDERSPDQCGKVQPAQEGEAAQARAAKCSQRSRGKRQDSAAPSTTNTMNAR